MKKLLAIALLALLPVVAPAVNRIDGSFINGAALQLTNNTTYSYGATWTNLYVWDFPQNGGLFNGYSMSMAWPLSTTNFIATTGASGTNYGPPYIAYLTNYTGIFSSTNQVAGGILVNTNVIQRAPWDDVPAFCDGNADYGQGCIIASAVCPALGTATNLLTFSFSKGDMNGYFDTQAANQFNFTLAVLGGTTNCVITTNLSSTFMTGAGKIRLNYVSTANSTSNGSPVVVNNLRLSGWSKP